MNSLNSDAFAILRLVINQLSTFDQIVEQLQIQINELSSQISTSMLMRSASSINQEKIINIIIIIAKFKKLSDSFMFNKNQKKLQNFIIKFYFKLSENAD